MFLYGMLCVNTFVPSYTNMASDVPGCIANKTKYLKKGKYASTEATHHFVPLIIETTGVFRSEANYFLH